MIAGIRRRLELSFDQHAFVIPSAHQVSRQSRPHGINLGQFRGGAKIDQAPIGAESIIHYSSYDIGAFTIGEVNNTADIWSQFGKLIQVSDNRPLTIIVMN